MYIFVHLGGLYARTITYKYVCITRNLVTIFKATGNGVVEPGTVTLTTVTDSRAAESFKEQTDVKLSSVSVLGRQFRKTF